MGYNVLCLDMAKELFISIRKQVSNEGCGLSLSRPFNYIKRQNLTGRSIPVKKRDKKELLLLSFEIVKLWGILLILYMLTKQLFS